MGAPARPEHILTSGRGTALALAHLPRPPRRTLVFGGPGPGARARRCRARDRALHARGPGRRARCGGRGHRLRADPRAPLGGRLPPSATAPSSRPRTGTPSSRVPGRLMAGAGALVAALVASSGPRARPRHRQARARAAPRGRRGRRACPSRRPSSSATGCAPTSWPPTGSARAASSCSPASARPRWRRRCRPTSGPPASPRVPTSSRAVLADLSGGRPSLKATVRATSRFRWAAGRSTSQSSKAALQPRPDGLVVVKEGSRVGLAHGADDLLRRQAETGDAAVQLLDERQVADRPIVGADGDRARRRGGGGAGEPPRRRCRCPPGGCCWDRGRASRHAPRARA